MITSLRTVRAFGRESADRDADPPAMIVVQRARVLFWVVHNASPRPGHLPPPPPTRPRRLFKTDRFIAGEFRALGRHFFGVEEFSSAGATVSNYSRRSPIISTDCLTNKSLTYRRSSPEMSQEFDECPRIRIWRVRRFGASLDALS